MGASALLLIRMIGSLAVVAFLLWILTKVARSRGLGSPHNDLIDVRAQRGLSRNASLILVQVGARSLLLGVADGGVQVLSEGDDLVARNADEADEAPEGQELVPSPRSLPSHLPISSGRLLDRLRDRTVRKQR